MVKPPLKMPVEKVLTLKPYSVIKYSTNSPSPKRQMQLRRALHSHTEKKHVKGETKTYKYEGIVKDERARIRNVLIVPNKIAEDVGKAFRRLNIEYEEIKVYWSPLNINYQRKMSRENVLRAKSLGSAQEARHLVFSAAIERAWNQFDTTNTLSRTTFTVWDMLRMSGSKWHSQKR